MSEPREPVTEALVKSLLRCAVEADRTYVGRHWPSMETLRYNGLSSDFTESGDGDRAIRRFLSTFSPGFVRDLLGQLSAARAAARADALAEIRAGVERLDTVAYPRADFAWSGETVAVVSCAEVLALLDPPK